MRNDALIAQFKGQRERLQSLLAPLERRQLIAGGVEGNEARIRDLHQQINHLSYLIQQEEDRVT